FRVDLAFGIAAGLVLLTGAARAMRYGKGLDYYLNNSFFHAKIGFFVAVALLSIYPTVTFLKWRPALKAGQVPSITPSAARWVKTVIRIELLALLLIPLLATFMARGLGVIPQ
ncbi:MAG TPA: DUF2214 domain-containing protein, partial [Pseudomonas sp.]|nr:DUF2214 domain-containing protein [Pseudomonas sp.]